MELIIEQMKLISLSEDPLPLLIDMKTNLIAISNKEVVTMFEVDYPLSHIQPLFDVLNSSSNEQINTCVDVLSHILNKVSPRMSLENLINQYIRGLDHPHEKVRLMVMKQILNCSLSTEATSLLLTHPPLLLTLVNSMGDSSTEVVKTTQQALVQLCAHPDATSHVFTSKAFEILQRIMGVSDSYRFYVYDLCVQISLVNSASLRVMSASSLLSQLSSEVFSGDILIQLNALELVSTFASNPEGLRHLKTDGIVSKLSYLLSTANTDTMASVLLPGLLKFFGHLGAAHPHIIAQEETLVLREIMRVSCDFHGSTEVSLQLIAFETLSHVGASMEGKLALRKFGVEMEQSLKDFSSHIHSLPSEMKVRVLEALAKLFHLRMEDQTEDMLSLLETWFSHLSDASPTKMVFALARHPFPEILLAALQLMHSLSLMPWGLRGMADEPGFMEWLLNRDSCKDKETKEVRFQIVATIHNHSSAVKGLLDEGVLENVEAFYKQGPFYVDAEPTLIFEREDDEGV